MPDQHALYTGPIRGTVTLADGTVVDVRPDVVYLDTLEQVEETARLIAERHVAKGHPHHDPDQPFTYEGN